VKVKDHCRLSPTSQISRDKSDQLEKLFDVLQVQYHTTTQDYACFPPMAQDKDDGTYGVH